MALALDVFLLQTIYTLLTTFTGW